MLSLGCQAVGTVWPRTAGGKASSTSSCREPRGRHPQRHDLETCPACLPRSLLSPDQCVPSPYPTDPSQVASAEPVGDNELGPLWAQWGHIQAWPGNVRKVWAGSEDTVAVTSVSRTLRSARPGCVLAVRWAGQAPRAARTQGRAVSRDPGRFLPEDQLRVSRTPTHVQPAWRSLTEGRGLQGVLESGSAGRRTAP